MNMHVDSADGKLYVPSLSAGTVKVIDTKSYEVEKTIQLHKDNAEADSESPRTSPSTSP